MKKYGFLIILYLYIPIIIYKDAQWIVYII